MIKTILVIEDDKELQKYLKDLLTTEGFSVKALQTGTEALETVEKIKPDLIILDLGLPIIKGESVCVEIKRYYPTLPIIVLTGKTTLNDKINAFDLGADDYITKPFIAEELVVRIKARLKNPQETEILKVKDLEINTSSMEVKKGKKIVELTPQEYKLLETMVINRNKVLSRETLLNKIWPNSSDIQTRVVDVYISYLRKKLDAGAKDKLIHSIRGFGYSIKG